MMSTHKAGAFALLAVLSFTPAAFAQYGPYGPMGGGPMGPAPYGMQPGGTESVVVAQRKVRAAQQNVDKLEREARADLQKDSAFAAAQKALDDAIAKRDALKAQLLDSLKASPEYSAATTALASSDALIHGGNTGLTERQIVDATDTAIDSRLAINKMETQALNSSPEYRTAELQVRMATADVDRLWNQYKDQNLNNNRIYRLAANQLEDAQAELEMAQNALRAARQQQAVQQAAQPRQRQSRGGGGGGGGRSRGRGGY